ncbi:MAG: DUF4384 domain-containing protein [Nitrospirota bacterium]
MHPIFPGVIRHDFPGTKVFIATCSWAWIAVLAGGPALAEPLKPVSVVAEGLAPFARDMSLEEVRNRARDDARRNAIEQAVGVFVRGTTVLHNSQITDELIASVARGVIEDEQWLDERIEEIKQDSKDKKDRKIGPSMAVYHTRIKAMVRPVRVERRAGFELRASLNKQVFQEGEEALIKVRSSQPAHLHLFSVTQDGAVTLLLPNRFLPQNQIAAEQEVVFPSEALRSLGIRLRVMLPKGSRKVVEYIKVIATRKPIGLVKEQSPEGVFQTFDGTEAAMIQDVVKRLALLEDEDWTEATLPYEVRQ